MVHSLYQTCGFQWYEGGKARHRSDIGALPPYKTGGLAPRHARTSLSRQYGQKFHPGPVVLQPQFDGQSFAHLHTHSCCCLLTVMPTTVTPYLSQHNGRSRPSRIRCPGLCPRSSTLISACQIKLPLLSLVEVKRVLPVATTVNHSFVEHFRKKIVAYVIMFLSDNKGSGFPASIDPWIHKASGIKTPVIPDFILRIQGMIRLKNSSILSQPTSPPYRTHQDRGYRQS